MVRKKMRKGSAEAKAWGRKMKRLRAGTSTRKVTRRRASRRISRTSKTRRRVSSVVKRRGKRRSSVRSALGGKYARLLTDSGQAYMTALGTDALLNTLARVSGQPMIAKASPYLSILSAFNSKKGNAGLIGAGAYGLTAIGTPGASVTGGIANY